MRPAIQYAAVAIVAFALGAGTQAWFTPRHLLTEKEVVQQHWQKVIDFNRHMNDPANYSWDLTPGFLGTSVPFDPMPHLAALVAAGEINHLDIVLPMVPVTAKANRHWMDFQSQRQKSLVYMTGNGWHRDFPVSGDPVMHLNLWYIPSATSEVQQLLRELEELSLDGKFD